MPKISKEKKEEHQRMKAKIQEIKVHLPYGYSKIVAKNLELEDPLKRGADRVNAVVNGRSHRMDIFAELIRLAKIEKKRKEDLFS